ncbi:DUF4013 domain-containing protein [Halosolutus halophilus]|uniref:DUF4013 domain-containing protein n=1 Tax=Halosolutus halophilus TaxID=1552990 RepID=UPI00223520AE|nr:DUF4013 domain-containing protein [Halosolutus halophilus]
MREALAYPIRGDHGEKALLSAWLCVFVHAIALPVIALVPLVGYATTVLSRGHVGDPPPFLERALVTRSLGATLLAVGYGIVPIGTALVTVRLLTGADQPPTDANAIFVLAGSTTILVVLAGYAYVLPIALANYARAGSLRAGVSGLVGVASHAAYFVGWASGIVLFLAGLAVSSAFADLGGLYTVAGSLVGAYAVLASSRRIARGYAEAADYRRH